MGTSAVRVAARIDPQVAGVDEAGRGPLAGPVVVAAVMLDPANLPSGLDDSKKLTTRRREALFDEILGRARAHAICIVPASEIDRMNILQATLWGMREALAQLQPRPARALIDGNHTPREACCPVQYLIGGDALEPAISAASILAKVTRDRIMLELDARHPGYGFARHKGYPTPEHLAALHALGPCGEHRRSYAPVRLALHAASITMPEQGSLLPE